MKPSTRPSKIRIYLIVNKVNNKLYIGQTRRTLRRRFYEHCWAAEHGSKMHLHRAIKKYGKENFKILHQIATDDDSEAHEIEKRYIKFLKTTVKGYNSSIGGSAPALGMLHTDEWKRNHSLAMSGSKHPLFGKKHSAESLARMSASHRKTKQRPDIPTAALMVLYTRLGTKTIGKMFGTCQKTVSARLRKAGVKLRSVAEAKELRKKRGFGHNTPGKFESALMEQL